MSTKIWLLFGIPNFTATFFKKNFKTLPEDIQSGILIQK
jgi:hypothetical protein